MMNTRPHHLLETANIAVSLADWRWMDGMLTRDGHRVRDLHEGGQRLVYQRTMRPCRFSTKAIAPDSLPDFADPATVGCLEALVQESLKGEVNITKGNGWWSIETEWGSWDDDCCPSYLHGLVRALGGGR